MPPYGPGRGLSAQELQQQQIKADSMLARFSEPERIYQTTQAITSAGGPTLVTPPNLNVTRAIESISILIGLRLTVSVGAYAAVAPEAPQNFLQNIHLAGNHKDYGNQNVWDIPGATAYAWGRLFQLQSGGGEYLISKAGGALTLANQPGRPFTSSFDGAVATHDMYILYHVPLGPSVMPSPRARKQSVNFLLQPADWGNSLQLQLTLGDASSFGDPTGATTAFAGYGGTGNPSISVFANYALLGDFQNAFGRSGLVIRNEVQLPNQTALGTGVNIAQLAHQLTTTIVLKTGTIQAAGLTAGIDTLATLSDVQLDATNITVDNKTVRNNVSNLMLKAYHERMLNTVAAQGYLPFTFVESGTPLTVYRGDRLGGASQINLNSNIISAAAGNRQRVIHEYIVGGPFPR